MTINSITEVSLVNLALGRMGSTQTITSLADGSNEAAQGTLWYPQTRDAMLCDFPWPWARAEVALAQIAGPEINNQVASVEWARSFRFPPDCLKIRRLVATPTPSASSIPLTTGSFLYPSGNDPSKRAVGEPLPMSYGLGSDNTGRLIFTDEYGSGRGLTLVYTKAVSDPTQFATDFADALVWRLAMEFSAGLNFSDAKRDYAEKMYEKVIRKARASAMNEIQSDIPQVRTQSEMVRRRWTY